MPPLDLRRLDALDLPVEPAVPAVRAALADRGVAVLQAEPGAGKTTSVPLRLADEPWVGDGRIVVLEPRRLAARAAARRMADLLGEDVGGTVGFRTRDERRVSGRTRIEVVTEGILTRRLQRDPALEGTALVVFDEFHERSLQADLGLALAVEVRRGLRPDLRLLVASATLDVDRVADLLGDGGDPAPVVASEGRTHPVEVVWRPRQQRQHLEPAVADAVKAALRDHHGDVLVFLPGAAAIRRTQGLLGDAQPLPGGQPVDVHPLFGALSAAEQDAALRPAPAGRRKVVLATDIAETSLTVEGVTVVVDGGEARSPRVDPRTGMTRLVTGPIAKSSADQRAGRAGRLEPGSAIRLWSKMEHAARPRHTPAEITQVDVADLVLESALWGAGSVAELALLDHPPEAAVAAATRLLTELGALDEDGRPTFEGRDLSDLPLHPRLGAVVLAGRTRGPDALATAVALAALLEDRDVLRGRPAERPADVALRLELLADPGRRHPLADGGALQRARRRADDLLRRLGEPRSVGTIDPDLAGALLVAGFPDRLAQARGRSSGGPAGAGRRGRFRLVGGSGCYVDGTDVLAAEDLLVVAETDGDRRDARILVAAPVTADEVVAVAGDRLEERTSLRWDDERDDLVVRTERRFGGVVLGSVTRRPDPGPDVVAALVAHVDAAGLASLPWTDRARRLQQRVAFLRRHQGEAWPDLGDDALAGSLDDWLAPMLPSATGRADLDVLDVTGVLLARLDHEQRRALDRLAPDAVEVPTGRSVALDWSGDEPALAVPVQELYGSTDTPTVLDGAVPVVVHLLSPAGRPVQVTSDLAGFWAGSWAEVRKDLAGRYPKHDWPEDPSTATPHQPGKRPR